MHKFKLHSPKNSTLIFWSGILGNAFDHYDSALYAFLAPFLAPIFFPDTDPIVGLILIYGIKSIGFFTRPLGAILFGHLALKYPIKTVLSITLSGVAVSTFIIGIIPGYATIGIFAPIILAIVRAVQGVFAAGEHNIAALFILEYVNNDKNHGKASSWYLCSTMSGTLLASLATAIVSTSANPTLYWRFAFILGIITGFIGIFLRLKADFTSNQVPSNDIKQSSIALLEKNKWKFIKIIFISSFSFITYVIPFIFLNNFIPLFSDIKTSELLIYNTLLLVVDIIMIPIFGYLADKFNIAKWMATASSILTITIIPLFYILPSLNIIGVILVKIWIIIIGVAFVAPFNALLFTMITGREKYFITSFAYTIGIELLGRSATTICLSLWYYTNSTIVPAIYIAFVSACASIALFSEIKYQKS